jgi:hypothetical protein
VGEQVSFEDIKKLFRETDRKMQETDRKMAETDRRMQETDRMMQETARQMRETDHKIGRLGNRLGEFVEGVVRPGLVRLFRERGVEVHQTIGDLEARRDGEAAQVDLLVVNEGHAVAVEVKSKLDVDAVDEHLVRLGKFKRLFPQYKETLLHGAVAAMVIPEEAARYAEKRGMFVIGHSGDDAVLLNSAGFEPLAW